MNYMDHCSHSEFGVMCRNLRVAKRLKQREVADGVGVSTSTWGNVESAAHRIIGQDVANRIANFFGLDDDSRKKLLDAWAATPLSEYGEKRKLYWAKRNAMRSKSNNHDRMRTALIDALGLLLMVVDDPGTLCDCDPFTGFSVSDPTQRCELCAGLEALGLDPYTTREKVVGQLAGLQEKIAAAAAAPVRP